LFNKVVKKVLYLFKNKNIQNMPIINWNTVPDYDEWGIDTYWSCNDWITWHQKLSKHFGEATATEIWNYAFAQSGNLSSNLDCNSLNASFRTYVKQHNLKPYSDIVTEAMGTTTDVVSGALSTTSDVASGIFDTTKSLFGGSNFKKTLNIVLIVGGIIGVAYVYRTFKKQ
jgi:hypothetical protein